MGVILFSQNLLDFTVDLKGEGCYNSGGILKGDEILEKLTDRRKVSAITWLFMIVYMVSYITRTNYGAVISEMEKVTDISKSQLSWALVGSFITYGAGQVISGILGDKFSPKRLISAGLLLTVCMNLILPFCYNEYSMTVVWCVNGLAQSFMWPPMVKIMTDLLTDEDYNNTVVKVAWGSSFGTIAVYLISPLLIKLAGWKSVFFFASACGALMLTVFNRFCPDIKGKKTVKKSEKALGGVKILFAPFMIGIMLSIVFQGMLRDGVTTWMPSYISETYNMSNIIAILTGVVLPIFAIFCFQAAKKLYVKKFNNPVLCGGLIFAIGAVSAAGLVFTTGKSAVFSIVFSAILTGCMHGANLMLVSMVPHFFEKFGNVSTVSGVVNSCTYIGSAISTYGIAFISENFGWNYSLIIWLCVAVIGTAITFICVKPWRKKMMD